MGPLVIAFTLVHSEALAAPDFELGRIYECSSGGTHTAWVQVTNAGTTATSGTWVDVFIGRATPPSIGEWGDFYEHTGALDPGEVAWFEVGVAPPAGGGGGWIDVILDTDELVAESDEGDNTGWIWSDFATCDLVDLEIESLSTPTTACPGEDIAPSTALTLHNPGPQDVSTMFHVGWYLSADTVLDATDRLLIGGRDQVSSVASGASAPVSIGVDIVPADAALGAQYLLVAVDEFDGVSEASEWDNIGVRPITIEACAPAVVELAAGGRQTCALLDDGAVRCWGDGEFGVLGYGNTADLGDDEDPSAAGDVPLGADAEQIEAGYYHTCAIVAGGDVRCWGRNDLGQLGYGDTLDRGDDEVPSAVGDVPLGGAAVELAAGVYHTCALLSTGAVRCWGDASFGQLGYGDLDTIGDDETPADAGDVPLGGAAVAIEAGDFHTCALLTSGALQCWGDNSVGQLGYGHTQPIGDDEAPSAAGTVDAGGAVTGFELGAVHTCAVLSTGVVRCWGEGGTWLGYGTTDTIGDDELPSAAGDVPTGLSSVSAVALGGHHSCALSSAGVVRCWGAVVSGGLGYGSPLPVARADLAGDIDVGGAVEQLVSGQGQICALLTTGAVRCWGDGYAGVLGYGDTADIGDDELPYVAGDVHVR